MKIKIGTLVSGPTIRSRSMVVQQKTGRPVQFEITAEARGSLLAWLERRGGSVDEFAFPNRVNPEGHLSTRQYARLVDEWVTATRGEMGQIVLTVLGMVAQMERRFIKERQREGIHQAKALGRYTGGKRRLDREHIKVLQSNGLGPSEIARQIGCSRMQVYRILAETD